ncbi:MAG: T9SS type A sorting domain-containing protein [Flavobacteriales bacterium]
MKKILFLFIFGTLTHYCNAQCEEGEIEVLISVVTDNWGYECYWQIQPEGTGCGDDPVIEGGNLAQVDCASAGVQASTGGNGYANNTTIQIDPICLTIGQNYTIHYIDDWGDGGADFEVFQDGIQTGFYEGAGGGNDFTFTAGDLTPAFIPGDRPCESLFIVEDGESLLIDNTGATATPGEVEPPEITCGAYGAWCPSNNGASNTMWVSFTPETIGSYEISTCNDGNTFDTALAVYSADDCSDFDTFSLVSGNDDAYIGCSSGSTGFASICYVNCLNVGQEYFIQVDGWGGGDIGVTELTVTSYEAPPELAAITTNIQCANVKGETGSRIVPQVNGWGVDYDVVWSGPNNYSSTDRVITDINQGDYTCILTNSCGETLTGTFTISMPNPVSSDFTIDNTTCVGAGDGSIIVSASGGNAPYEYLWTGEDDFVADGDTISDLSEGTYALVVIDDNNCEYSSAVTVESDNELEFSLGDDQVICLDETVVLEGPAGFFLYDWQDGSENSTFIVNGSDGEGVYSINLTVSNSIGCEHTDVVTITVDNCLEVSELYNSVLELYPNPVQNTLFIELPEAVWSRYADQELGVVITDLRGAQVMIASLNQASGMLDLNNLASGVYVVQLMANSEVSRSIKIVKR